MFICHMFALFYLPACQPSFLVSLILTMPEHLRVETATTSGGQRRSQTPPPAPPGGIATDLPHEEPFTVRVNPFIFEVNSVLSGRWRNFRTDRRMYRVALANRSSPVSGDARFRLDDAIYQLLLRLLGDIRRRHQVSGNFFIFAY